MRNFFVLGISQSGNDEVLPRFTSPRPDSLGQKSGLRNCVFSTGSASHRSVRFLLGVFLLLLPVSCCMCSCLESQASRGCTEGSKASRCRDAAYGKATFRQCDFKFVCQTQAEEICALRFATSCRGTHR